MAVKKNRGTSACSKLESGTLDELIVVCTAQTTVTTDDDHSDVRHLTLLQQWQFGSVTALQAANNIAENTLATIGEGTSLHNSLLGTTKLSGSYHLHGISNLLGVF